MTGRIPAFMSFDVEPDGFQAAAARSWSGVEHLTPRVATLRERLATLSGDVPVFGWYLRMDPQIASLYGDAAFAAHEFGGRPDGIAGDGDVLGIHVHPLRWSEDAQSWDHDCEDRAWMTECIESSVAAFTECYGEAPVRYRHGAGVLTNRVVDTVDRLQFRVDLSLEPVAGWALHSLWVASGVDRSPLHGNAVDCSAAPVEMYRPSVADFRVDGGRTGRDLVMFPTSVTRWQPKDPWRRRVRRRVRHGSKAPDRPGRAQVLYPSQPWPNPSFFWDLAERQLASMEHPHLSLGIRTDAPSSREAQLSYGVLDALPEHPLAKRLQFVDPIAVASATPR